MTQFASWTGDDSQQILADNINEKKLTNLLSKKERKLLIALASLQLSYGQTNEAIAILLLCRVNAPDDLQVLRLLIRAYIALGWWDKSEEMIKEFNHYSKNQHNIAHLFLALTFLGKKKLAKAREQFKFFCKNRLRVTE